MISFGLNTIDINIISYSLYGNNPLYTHNAIENAKTVSLIYPGWKARYYIDETVPKEIINQLVEHEAQIYYNDKSIGLSGSFWRFYIASDPTSETQTH